RGKDPNKMRWSIVAALFALSGLICWCGISQVIGNSVSSSMENAFGISPITTAIILTAVSAVIVLRKNATVKVLDIIVPIMAGCFFFVTLIIIFKNISLLPFVFKRIFAEAFGLRQIAGGSIGAVIMNGVKRGLFSNEAGSGSAPCAAAAADVDHPAKSGLLQTFGVFVDTIVICSCTAMVMLLAPAELLDGLAGMDLLQAAMHYHFGNVGVVFIAITLLLFAFSTFLGVLFYARSNVAYLFGDNWTSQTAYKILALVMLFIGCLATYTFVWDLGDVGIGLMTIFNMLVLLPMSKEALACLKEYEGMMKTKKQK
ncbi:MAG: alanine:cation symporter family protein, partial [Anaerotignum sp.]|nr:alanine:cation symporter family protein [Anaerotignum sp.]